MIKQETIYCSISDDMLQVRVCEDKGSPFHNKVQVTFMESWRTIDEAIGYHELIISELRDIKTRIYEVN